MSDLTSQKSGKTFCYWIKEILIKFDFEDIISFLKKCDGLQYMLLQQSAYCKILKVATILHRE